MNDARIDELRRKCLRLSSELEKARVRYDFARDEYDVLWIDYRRARKEFDDARKDFPAPPKTEDHAR